MDALELLDHLGIKQAEAYLGYSTGVQVGLELAAIAPHRVKKLVLLNGAHGQLLHSLCQPVFRVPMIGDYFVHLLNIIANQKHLWDPFKTIIMFSLVVLRFCVLKPFCFLTGRNNYEWYTVTYFTDFFNHGIQHSVNYLKMPAQLDCHSCFHLLHEIKNPTLIVTGMLDFITPAYHS